MGFWARVSRFFRAIFGGALDRIEDPELLLKQTLDDMRAKVPRMNEGLVKMRASISLLEMELKKYEGESLKIKSTIRAALEADDESVAARYALRLKQLTDSIDRTGEQFEAALKAYENARELRSEYKKEVERKSKEFEQAIEAKRLADFKKELANAFESFEVGDVDYTYQEMMSKLRRQIAENEARLEVAAEGIDLERYRLERRAEELEAKEILEQFKLEWGIEPKREPAEKTLGTESVAPEPERSPEPESEHEG